MLNKSCVIPLLETDRLILAGHQHSDFPALAKLWATQSVVRYLGGSPSTERESWMRMLEYLGLWPLLGFGYWAVREKQSGLYVGDLGFADFHRMTRAIVKGTPEAGWIIASEFQGQGFATEAMEGALFWLKSQHKFKQTVCLIEPNNLASLRVAQKLGYIPQREVLIQGICSILYKKML
ncbi:GNAT family N-acetyltransferase [Providencia sneebia]|uniref:N-acetyltransferase GCN5 n=1 Tax=Providencia sneebia DSM 19967 TaxID=1141660 RepID=K8WAI5_9GAMM|nr:N-acetyltransferase GCN5 [Providencia sneebia DSM 19967]